MSAEIEAAIDKLFAVDLETQLALQADAELWESSVEGANLFTRACSRAVEAGADPQAQYRLAQLATAAMTTRI